MKKFIVYVLSIIIPVFGGMALVNFLVDPGHVYSSSYIDNVVEGARRGLCVTNVGNMDERIFKKKLIEVYKDKKFDYLVIGSSRVMTISEDCLNDSTLLNLGVSGCKLEDMIALYQICKENGITFKNVIIGTDPTLFNANDKDSRWESIGSYYYAYKGAGDIDTKSEFQRTLIQNLFSPSYFKSAIKAIPNALAGTLQIEYVKTYINEGGTKRPDGSIYYAREYREIPQSSVDANATTCCHGSFNKFESFSEERRDIFTKFVETLHNNGANIIIWCCPYHPIFYKRALEMKGLPSSISFISKYANKSGFKIIGSFNPDELGLTNKDFYDGLHVRKETVDDLLSKGL
jgi:hypothetical protein